MMMMICKLSHLPPCLIIPIPLPSRLVSSLRLSPLSIRRPSARANVDAPTSLDGLDNYVNTVEFKIICAEQARELAWCLAADDESDLLNDPGAFWPNVDSSHEPSEFEARLYHAGVSPRGYWPRLVYRDSDDVFEEPMGPDTRVREVELAHVPKAHEFARNELWERVRDWVRCLVFVSVG